MATTKQSIAPQTTQSNLFNWFSKIISGPKLPDSLIEAINNFPFKLDAMKIELTKTGSMIYYDDIHLPIDSYFQQMSTVYPEMCDPEIMTALMSSMPKFAFEYNKRVYGKKDIEVYPPGFNLYGQFNEELNEVIENSASFTSDECLDCSEDYKCDIHFVPSVMESDSEHCECYVDKYGEFVNCFEHSELNVNRDQETSNMPSYWADLQSEPSITEDMEDIVIELKEATDFLPRQGPHLPNGNLGEPNKTKAYQPFEHTKVKRTNPRTPTQITCANDLRRKRKAEKLEKGGVWKKHSDTRADKHKKLLSEAFYLMNDKKIGDKIAAIETLETEIENLLRPCINSDFYDNAHKEREFYISQLDKEKKKYKEMDYSRGEIQVNKYLAEYFDEWKLSDAFSMVRSSTLSDDVEKIANFINENASEDELVKQTLIHVHHEVNKTPFLDKAAHFLQQLIAKIKPTALIVDSLKDIHHKIDIQKEEFEVKMGDPIPLNELINEYGGDYDVRDDHQRRGDLIHKDPLLRHFSMTRIDRSSILGSQVDYDGIFSAELLFQLLSPSVVSISSDEKTVLSKMTHIAANIHTINLPKFSIIKYNTNVIEDTLLVARAIFLTRRRVTTALGFPVHQQ